MKLWVTGKVLNPNEGSDKWEFVGVFDTAKKAEAACKDENYFIGPIELNDMLPDETVPWIDGYYPLAEKCKVKET